MIRAADDKDAIVALQSVNLVEKVAAHAIANERVQVFKDEVAWRKLTGLAKDLLD